MLHTMLPRTKARYFSRGPCPKESTTSAVIATLLAPVSILRMEEVCGLTGMRLQLPQEAHAGEEAGPHPPAALRVLQWAVPGSGRRNAQPRFGSQWGSG